jgi:hypothetical protein
MLYAPSLRASPEVTYKRFVKMRDAVLNSQEDRTILDPDLEAKLRLDSPILFANFVVCRASVAATMKRERHLWFRVSNALIEAFFHELQLPQVSETSSPRLEPEEARSSDLDHDREE